MKRFIKCINPFCRRRYLSDGCVITICKFCGSVNDNERFY